MATANLQAPMFTDDDAARGASSAGLLGTEPVLELLLTPCAVFGQQGRVQQQGGAEVPDASIGLLSALHGVADPADAGAVGRRRQRSRGEAFDVVGHRLKGNAERATTWFEGTGCGPQV